MSQIKVEVVRVDGVLPHPNADRLELASIGGMAWTIVVQKGAFKIGDRALFFPIDSVLPEALDSHIFPEDSKIKLDQHRIKTIRIRGQVSQGLLIPMQEIVSYALKQKLIVNTPLITIGGDWTSVLGVTKWEPKESAPFQSSLSKVKRKQSNPYFQVYTDIQNIKHHPSVFVTGEPVVITTKLHGTNFRAGYVPTAANTWWKKIKKWMGLLPPYEFVYGSHKVQLQDGYKTTNYYPTNVYQEMVDAYGLRDRLCNGEVLYGEIVGDGIQKNYSYGLKGRKAVFFDLMKDGKYEPFWKFQAFCELLDLPVVPLLYEGPYQNIDHVMSLAGGDDTGPLTQKIREGVVVKGAYEQTHPRIGRKALKAINPEYLLQKDMTEHH